MRSFLNRYTPRSFRIGKTRFTYYPAATWFSVGYFPFRNKQNKLSFVLDIGRFSILRNATFKPRS